MEQATQTLTLPKHQDRRREGYHEPLLIKHERLRDITGVKYGEKLGVEKQAVES